MYAADYKITIKNTDEMYAVSTTVSSDLSLQLKLPEKSYLNVLENGRFELSSSGSNSLYGDWVLKDEGKYAYMSCYQSYVPAREDNNYDKRCFGCDGGCYFHAPYPDHYHIIVRKRALATAAGPKGSVLRTESLPESTDGRYKYPDNGIYPADGYWYVRVQ